jgi:hypothetical protein
LSHPSWRMEKWRWDQWILAMNNRDDADGAIHASNDWYVAHARRSTEPNIPSCVFLTLVRCSTEHVIFSDIVAYLGHDYNMFVLHSFVVRLGSSLTWESVRIPVTVYLYLRQFAVVWITHYRVVYKAQLSLQTGLLPLLLHYTHML